MRKFIYTVAKAKKITFVNINLIWSDILFMEGDQYAILSLKWSKTDTEYTGMQIILVATGERTCPVAALKTLFIQD